MDLNTLPQEQGKADANSIMYPTYPLNNVIATSDNARPIPLVRGINKRIEIASRQTGPTQEMRTDSRQETGEQRQETGDQRQRTTDDG